MNPMKTSNKIIVLKPYMSVVNFNETYFFILLFRKRKTNSDMINFLNFIKYLIFFQYILYLKVDFI